jgi:hypothetical protein
VASSITVSGTNAITALASADAVPGTVKVVTASGAFTLTNGSPLVLPSGANITAASGDRFLAVALTNTNVAVFAYTRADGSAIVNPSVPLGAVLYGDWGTIPPKTVYGYGQAISRASYPGYLAAVTRAQVGTLTAGNNTIASVGNTFGLGAGMQLEGTGIPSGATISSVTSSTIVMSTTATANGAQTVTAFITGYGSGGDSTTVGVKDCRGRVIAGRDNMDGGGGAGRLTSSYFGTSATRINGTGGLESSTITTSSMLPTIVSSNPSQSISIAFGNAVPYAGSGGIVQKSVDLGTTFLAPTSTGGWGTIFGATTINGISTTFANASPQGFNSVQPTVIAECVVAG